jgi:Arc/MetJ-type ribon-helix-helix transcriptional regulator
MSDIHKVSIALTGEQMASLKAAVDTGEYATTSELVHEASRNWAVQTPAEAGRSQAAAAIVGRRQNQRPCEATRFQ